MRAIGKYLAGILEARGAKKLAVAEFKKKYRSRRISMVMVQIDSTTNIGYVVTIAFGDTRPPDRSWWYINADREGVVELSYHEAKEYVNIPDWR